jgi:ElaB/YqjD/DUF883 family membrane-anchored ribosome-binding protein
MPMGEAMHGASSFRRQGQPKRDHSRGDAEMTQEYPPTSTPSRRRGAPLPPQQEGTADVVKGQAAELSQAGVQAGKHTAEVAREQASGVVAEVSSQGKNLLGQAQDQLAEQASRGQQRLAEELLSLSDQLSSMAENSGQDGMATDLTRQAASRAREAGQWLKDRRPEHVVDELQSFARRRPAVFLALAAGAGLVAGRLTRGIKAAADDDSAPAAPMSSGTVTDVSGLRAQPPEGAAYPPETVTGLAGGAVASAGGLVRTGDVEATDPGPARDDGTALTDDQADLRDLP